MEVRGQQPQRPLPALQRFEQERQELIRSGRAKTRDAREARSDLALRRFQEAAEAREAAVDESRSAETRRADHVELSAVAREVHVESEEQARHVEALREEYARDGVVTPERAEKAAQRLLGA